LRAAGPYLVGDDVARRRARVGGDDDAAVEQAADDGGAGAGGARQGHALCVQGGIAAVVAEIEAGHGQGFRGQERCSEARRDFLEGVLQLPDGLMTMYGKAGDDEARCSLQTPASPSSSGSRRLARGFGVESHAGIMIRHGRG
jgi:hypothetical protein